MSNAHPSSTTATVSTRTIAWLRAVFWLLVIIAVAVYALFLKLGYTGTLFAFVVSHVIVALPFTIISIINSLKLFDQSIEDAAVICGASRLQGRGLQGGAQPVDPGIVDSPAGAPGCPVTCAVRSCAPSRWRVGTCTGARSASHPARAGRRSRELAVLVHRHRRGLRAAGAARAGGRRGRAPAARPARRPGRNGRSPHIHTFWWSSTRWPI